MASGEDILLFLCLSLIYGAVTIFSFMRIIRIHRFSPEWKQTKIFYGIVISQASVRTIIFTIFIFKTKGLQEKIIFFLLSVPDSLFLIDYVLLVLQLFSVIYYTHSETEQTASFLAGPRRRHLRLKCSSVIYFFTVVWVILQCILYIVYFANGISSSSISTEIGATNLAIPAFSLAAMIYINVKFSGMPPRSSAWKRKLFRINWVTLFWTMSRLFRGIINIIISYSNKAISEDLSRNTDQLVEVSVWVLVLMVSEVICLLLVLDYAFIGIFLFSEEENFVSSYPSMAQIDEEVKEDVFIRQNPIIEESELEVGEKISEGRLGSLFKAIYKEEEVAYRKISFTRLSRYVIQEFKEEIEGSRTISSQKIVPVYGIVMDIPTLGIVEPLYSQTLFKYLHVEHNQLSLARALMIAKDLCISIQEIHFQRKVHGHLTSHNIMLSSSLKPIIADLGFNKVKKYAAIMFGYSTKSGWSSPEILTEKRLVPVKCLETDDIYSFGMILWEMVTHQVPFADYSLKIIEQKVVTEGLRPVIPSNLDRTLENLILSCWNKDPNTRPSLTLINSTLDTLIKH